MSNPAIPYALLLRPNQPEQYITASDYSNKEIHNKTKTRQRLDGYELLCPGGCPISFKRESCNGRCCHFFHLTKHSANECAYFHKYSHSGGEGESHRESKLSFNVRITEILRRCGNVTRTCKNVIERIVIDPTWHFKTESRVGDRRQWYADVAFFDNIGALKLVVEIMESHPTLGIKRDWLRAQSKQFVYAEVCASDVLASHDGRVFLVDCADHDVPTCEICQMHESERYLRVIDRLVSLSDEEERAHQAFHCDCLHQCLCYKQYAQLCMTFVSRWKANTKNLEVKNMLTSKHDVKWLNKKYEASIRNSKKVEKASAAKFSFVKTRDALQRAVQVARQAANAVKCYCNCSQSYAKLAMQNYERMVERRFYNFVAKTVTHYASTVCRAVYNRLQKMNEEMGRVRSCRTQAMRNAALVAAMNNEMKEWQRRGSIPLDDVTHVTDLCVQAHKHFNSCLLARFFSPGCHLIAQVLQAVLREHSKMKIWKAENTLEKIMKADAPGQKKCRVQKKNVVRKRTADQQKLAKFFMEK
jgi:hypothetical protein